MALKKLPKDVQSLIESSSNINCFTKAIEELVYNSIDAESTSIAIRVNLEDKSIQVVDNGFGIAKNDMTKVGIKHMTSKCIGNNTLKEIPSFYGYRGLALAYIIDISDDVKIISRHETTEESWVSEFVKGKRMDVCQIETRPSKGTTVQIKGFLYNLAVQSKKVNSVQEMQDIKQFLEHLSIIKNNLSLSLRDNASNEIIFQMPKCKDVYQKINMIFGIESKNIQELKVEKDKYKVEGFFGKGLNQQNHIVYLNKRYLQPCRVHKTIDIFLTKYLSLHNNVKLKPKSKHANFIEDIDVNNKNIPFYVVFLYCPFNSYNLYQMSTKVNLEFNDWTAITNLLEKMVKFYSGNGKLQELKNNGIAANNMLIANNDIKDKVKNIVQKVLINNTKISQLQNGVKGKITKRKKTKKKDISLSKIITCQKQIVSSYPNKINRLTKSNVPVSFPKSLINYGKNETPTSPIESTRLNKIMETPEVEIDFDRNPTKYIFSKGKKYKYTKTKTRMDFSLLFNNPTSNSKNINDEIAEKIKLIMNQFNKTIERTPKNNYSKIKKHKIKKNLYKVTINGCVPFSQALKQIDELKKNINNCLGVSVDKHYHSRADLITTVLHTQNDELNFLNQNRFLADSKYVPGKCNKICISYKENYKNNPFTQYSIPKKSIKKNNANEELKVVNNDDDRASIFKDSQIIYKNPKEIIKQSLKQQLGTIKCHTNNQPHNKIEKRTKNAFFINNSVTTYDSHILYSVQNTNKRRHENGMNYFISNDIFNRDKFILKQTNNPFTTLIQNKRQLFKSSKSNKKLLPIECSYSIHDSSDNVNNPLIFSDNDIALNFNQTNKSIRTFLLKNGLPDKSPVKLHNIQLDNNIKKKYIEKKSCKDIEITNHCGLKSNVENINISNSNEHPKRSNDICLFDKIQQTLTCDIFEDCNEKDSFLVNSNINVSHANQQNDVDNEKDINKYPKKNNSITIHENELNTISREVNLNTFIENKSNSMHTKIDKSVGCFDTNSSNDVNLNNNENVKLTLNNKTEQNIDKLTKGSEYTRYKLLKNNLIENNLYLDEETGMVVENSIVEDSNIFALHDRLRFIPKGLSPIFANYTRAPKPINILNKCDYFNNTLYNDFENDVQVGSEIFEARVQNVEEFTSKEINKVNIRIKKDNANIAFDKKSLESIDVLKQVDNKFIAAKMTAKKLNTLFSVEYLVLFDQHAADERVRLEKNMNDYIIRDNIWKAKTLDSFILPLSTEEALYLHNYKEKFAQFGLSWTSVNDKEISVTAIPEAIFGKHFRNVDVIINSVKKLIQELVRIIKDQKGSVNLYPRSIMDLVANEACRYAIKFGDSLSTSECVQLLDALQTCKVPFQCAHGRPVLAVMLEVKSNIPSYRINFEKLKIFAKNK